MANIASYMWIALGSALGGMGRYACSRAIAARFGDQFPWGTLAVNVAGSFLIGGFAALAGPMSIAPDLRLFVTAGICGGFTTFSSFSLQTLDLIRRRAFAAAMGNMVLSVLLCLISVWAGSALATAS